MTKEEKALEALDDYVKDLEAKLAAARAAIAAFGRVPVPKGLSLVAEGGKRKMSAAGRAAIGAAARKRWAKYRKQKRAARDWRSAKKAAGR